MNKMRSFWQLRKSNSWPWRGDQKQTFMQYLEEEEDKETNPKLGVKYDAGDS